MKKGQVVSGIIQRVEFPNKGILTIDDKGVIIKNALVGQKVEAVVNKVRKGKAEARLVAVLEKAWNEVESPCPHFGACGGCTYQNLPYQEQLALKESQVQGLLDDVYRQRGEDPKTAYEFQGIKGSPEQYAYRNKMEFSFGDTFKNGPLALGMHKRGGFYDIVTVSHCQIVDEDYRLILATTLDYFAKREASFYHRLRHEGYLRHLLVRKAKYTGEILIACITSTQEMISMEGLVDAYLELEHSGQLSGQIAGILHTLNDSVADVVQSDDTKILYGKDYFHEKILGMTFKISQFSFFQTNTLGAEVLYTTARDYIGELEGKESVIFDLYSGTGTITQMLSPVAKRVVGVEIVEEAVEAAKVNAKLNGITNCEFIAGDVLKVLDTIEEKPDFIVLDPPRDGIHPKAITKIIDYGVEQILYISCKPTSLARDLGVFLENGYCMEKAVCVDMFPGTVHVETITLMTRCGETAKNEG
ncbi:MAG: 23S rRNA (uracil(1939)-C(5))-methyltransferase RlmD [Eubacteriales bacterium]